MIIVDPIKFTTFLILRLGATLVILAGLIVYIRTGKQVAHFRKSAMLTYLTLVASMLPLCIITEEKLPYYVAYSTVFFAVSILAIWPLRYFVLPMMMAVSVLVFVHRNTVNDLKTTTTSIFLMINVCSMSSVASWLTYRNYLKNESLRSSCRIFPTPIDVFTGNCGIGRFSPLPGQAKWSKPICDGLKSFGQEDMYLACHEGGQNVVPHKHIN